MKLGAEKKGEVIALVALLAVAAGLMWRSMGSSGATGGSAAAAPDAPAVAAVVPVGLAHLDPTLHVEKLAQLRARAYAGSGRDLFHFGSEPGGAAAPGPRRAPAPKPVLPPPPPPGPPPPPPIPLRFYGFADANGMPERIFLQMGDDIYVASQGQVIEHRYLIESIGKVSVRVKDLVTQSEQDLPLQQG